jgi:hypothetical protein
LTDIDVEKRADEGDGSKEAAPGVEQPAPAPTVVIDREVRAQQLD